MTPLIEDILRRKKMFLNFLNETGQLSHTYQNKWSYYNLTKPSGCPNTRDLSSRVSQIILTKSTGCPNNLDVICNWCTNNHKLQNLPKYRFPIWWIVTTVLGTFPKAFSQGRLPKWQLPKCTFSQITISQVATSPWRKNGIFPMKEVFNEHLNFTF